MMRKYFTNFASTALVVLASAGCGNVIAGGLPDVAPVQFPGNFPEVVIPPRPRTYTADEVDKLFDTIRNDLAAAKKELNDAVTADREATRQQIVTGLNALGKELITEDVKQKMGADVADVVEHR